MSSERDKILTENFSKLCDLMDKEKLIPVLSKSQFFSNYLSGDEMVRNRLNQRLNEKYIYVCNNYQEVDIDEKFILESCFESDENYDKLVDALLHTGCDEMAFILDPNVIDMTDLKRCDPKNGYVEKFSFDKNGSDINDKCELVWSDQINANTLSDIYNMTAIPRGYCLLINNYFTKGTYKELQKFRNIFYQLQFDVIMEKNLTADQIKQKLIDISKDENVKKHNAFIFMIITHGNSKREIYGFDGQSIQIDSLIELLNNKNCEALQNKPKIFFFNCCRGGLIFN